MKQFLLQIEYTDVGPVKLAMEGEAHAYLMLYFESLLLDSGFQNINYNSGIVFGDDNSVIEFFLKLSHSEKFKFKFVEHSS
jgi:hypothetical protein